MKGIYVIAIAFLASWAVSAAKFDRKRLVRSVSKQDLYVNIPTVCPYPKEEHPMNTTTNLPHEYDCTKFYKCFLGNPIEQLCPLMIGGDPVTRLHYNRLLQVCDWPWQAGCESCPQMYPNRTYPTSSRISNPTDDCNQYHDCINGVSHPGYCTTPGTCFSRTCQECVPNRNGGHCNGSPPPPPPPPPPACTNPSGAKGDKIDHSCDCAKYYTCHSPDWILTECGGGKHFSPTKKECLPPDEAGCLVP